MKELKDLTKAERQEVKHNAIMWYSKHKDHVSISPQKSKTKKISIKFSLPRG